MLGGGQEGGQLKRQRLAACVQNPCGAWQGYRLPAISTCARLHVRIDLNLKLVSYIILDLQRCAIEE